MSVFFEMLASADPLSPREQMKIGILVGSMLAGLAGWILRRKTPCWMFALVVHVMVSHS